MRAFNSTLHTRRQRKHAVKPERLVDPIRLKAVKDLGCIVCRRLGRGWVAADVHHMKRTLDGGRLGLGQKAGDDMTIPLCPGEHHWNGSQVNMPLEAFEAAYGNELELLEATNQLLEKQEAA